MTLSYVHRIKKKKYPVGMSVSIGARLGHLLVCTYCLANIMRNQGHAIRKVRRFVGGGFDTSQYHFYYVEKTINPVELQLLMGVIKALGCDLELK
jgi:hypothetical protein